MDGKGAAKLAAVICVLALAALFLPLYSMIPIAMAIAAVFYFLRKRGEGAKDKKPNVRIKDRG